MKVLVFVCLVLTAITHVTNGQEITFKKGLVSTVGEVDNIKLTFDQKNKFIREFFIQKANDRNGMPVEEIIHDFNGAKIIVHHGSGNSELIKYVNGKIQARRPYSNEEEVYPINEKGDLILADAGGFAFLSSHLEVVSIYKPFESGVSDSKFGCSDKLVCIYAAEELPPKKYKLGLLNHEGKLIAEREFESDRYGAMTVNVIGDQVFILFTSYDGKGSKIIAFDNSLNILWERSPLNKVKDFSCEVNHRSKSLMVITEEKVIGIDIVNGQSKWELTTDELYGKVVSNKIFSSAYVLNGQYVAAVLGEFEDEGFLNCKAVILDAQTGRKKYVDELGSFHSWPKVMGGNEGLIITADSQIFSYEKTFTK